MSDTSSMNPTPAPIARSIASLFGVKSLTARTGMAWALFLGTGAAFLDGCGSTSPAPSSNNAQGAVLVDPLTGKSFVVDANSSGQANRISLISSYWGRLVDVYSLDTNPADPQHLNPQQFPRPETLRFSSFVIGDNIASDLTNFRLDRNPITEIETVTILHDPNDADPALRAAYVSAFSQLDRNVQPLKLNGLNVLPTATLTACPRNSALVLVFDDLLSASSITAKNIAVFTGYPPVLPYEPRVIPDSTHGDLFDSNGDGTPEFHTTRVVIDLTVSQVESQQSSPPLPVNSLGLPEAQVSNQPNVLVRIPTRAVPAIGQLTTLANLGGSGMNFASNGPNDPVSPTEDVVRSMRSASADLGDPNNGFLVDQIAPRVIAVQGIGLTVPPSIDGINAVVTVLFDTPACAPTPRVGDVIRIGSSALAVVTQPGNPPSAGAITGLHVRLEIGRTDIIGMPPDPTATFISGVAQYLMPYDPTLSLPPACFVRFSPPPTALPDQGVAPNSSVTIRFSEPMDPSSVSAFENFAVTRVSNASTVIVLGNTIVGTVQPSLDLKEFTYTPQLPFERNAVNFPAGEDYRLTLTGGANGAIDLSGRGLVDALQPILFRMAGTAGDSRTRCFAFRFNSADEDANNAPELRGQFLYNLTKGTIRPRAVSRFSAVADATQPVVGLMVPFTAPIQTPLSNLGSKMMTLYRYHDLGFGLVDDSTLNLDLEGLAWSPFAGLQVDTYSRFRMAVCHSLFLPDEIIDPASLLPSFPLSGLVKTFDSNQLSATKDPLKIVHQKDRGYSVQPVDAFVSSTGTLMMPYPMNRGLPTTQYTRYTFRDTSLLEVGGPGGSGVETNINALALGVTAIKLYPATKVPSLGLPLLMEFRCYQDDAAFGLNGFKINLALNSSARPAFRAFSTGGVLANGSLFKIDPDNEPIARAGINPGTGAPTGFGTETDPSFYVGQADFVVRVNRVHTIWLDTLQFTAQYQTPVVDPPNALQPAGTSVIVALRGATNVSNGATPPPGQPFPRFDALKYDPYGDPRANVVAPGNFTVSFPVVGGVPDNTWKTNLALLNNMRFVQARITMISNPDTLLFPEITAMGFSLLY